MKIKLTIFWEIVAKYIRDVYVSHTNLQEKIMHLQQKEDEIRVDKKNKNTKESRSKKGKVQTNSLSIRKSIEIKFNSGIATEENVQTTK